ncbi:MAG: exodeoxyribonuclease VII small subunit [Planctomycetota bacterium]
MAKEQTIEECFALIEQAVAALEDGQLPLEEALKRYEEGLRGVRQARTQLDGFAARLEELREDGEVESPNAPGC